MDMRWNIKVSEETDRRLRVYMSEEGLEGESLSRFVEEAVEEKLFGLTVQRVKERNAGYPSEEVEGAVAETVAQARRAGRTRH